jgi:hypothetical protein
MPNSLLRRGVTGALGLLLASSTLIGVAAGLAPATASVTQATGYVEICKVLAPAPNGVVINTAASFSYSIWSGETQVGSATVTAGFCSNEIAVPVASSGYTPITIAETQAPWYSVASITELAGQNYIKSGSINLATGSVTVNVGANANVDTVTYTNDPVTGYVEICKLATTGSGLTGTYAFTVTGADGFSSTAAGAVAVNGCSDPIAVPAGTVTVSEAGTNLYVTGITATLNGQTSTNWITNPSASNPDLTDGVVTVNVTPSLDTSKQTDVTYTNNVVAFKLCKSWDSATTEPGGSSTVFPFTLSASGVAGPNTVPATASLMAGQCTNPVSLRPGTSVTVTEGIVPGTKVESIGATGAESVTTPASLTTRSVTITVGTPITSSSAPTDEAIVTFLNEAADPGTLKICKAAGTNPGPPIGTVFDFTTSVTGTAVTAVNIGGCSFVGGTASPTEIPYNTTVTITETPSTGNVASAISTSPTYVELNGSPNTSELVTPAGAAVLGAMASVPVTIGEDTLTEATFTDVDPPAPSGAPVTVSIPGGSDLGVTTGLGVSVATAAASSSAVTNAAAESVASVASVNTVATASTVKTLTAAQKRALLKRDKALLKTVDSRINIEKNRVAHTKGAVHRADVKALATLKAMQHALNVEIGLL